MSGLSEDKVRAALLPPCECGHDLDDHGGLSGCWECECARRFMALMTERVERIVAARVEAAVGEVVGRVEDALGPQRCPVEGCGWDERGTSGGAGSSLCSTKPGHPSRCLVVAVAAADYDEDIEERVRAALASATAPQGEGGEQ